MAIFLDANIFLDLLGRKNINIKSFIELYGSELYISSLSVHILFYSFKLKIPNEDLSNILHTFNIIETDEEIIRKAMTGPTPDLEDNILLHSAVKKKCEIFLTHDNNLLKLGYFGEMRITIPEQESS